MKSFIMKMNKITKKLWVAFLVVAILSMAALVGCSKSQYGYGRGYGPYPPGHPNFQRRLSSDFLQFSNEDTLSIQNTDAYGRFLEDILLLCRHNRNNGVVAEWHYSGSFGNPNSSCQWATQNYTDFIVDLYMDTDPEHGSIVDIDFSVGADGYWSPNIEITGELRVQENGHFKVIYDLGHQQPRLVIKVAGSLEDFVSDDRRNAKVTVEYDGETIGRDKISVVEELPDTYGPPDYYNRYPPPYYH